VEILESQGGKGELTRFRIFRNILEILGDNGHPAKQRESWEYNRNLGNSGNTKSAVSTLGFQGFHMRIPLF